MSEAKYDYKEVCQGIAARKKMEEAAPDLYEALTTWLKSIDAAENGDDITGMLLFTEAEKMARAAIKKATP